MSIGGTKAFANYDIAVTNTDGVNIYYKYINLGKELGVSAPESIFGSGGYKGNINIPEEVTYNNNTYKVTAILDYAFYDNNLLLSVNIPNGVTTIGKLAFHACIGLTSMTIPNSVVSIGDGAFSACQGLAMINISENLVNIGVSVFGGCISLTSLTIPDGVVSIGGHAFSDCSNLLSVTIPNSVTSIEDLAFQNCLALKSVIIGKSTSHIGYAVFKNCPELRDVYCYAKQVPQTANDAFVDLYSIITLHIPKGCVYDYSTSDPWYRFKGIVEIEGEYDGADSEQKPLPIPMTTAFLVPVEAGFFNLYDSFGWSGHYFDFDSDGDKMNFDASAYDYVWVKFANNTGKFRFGLTYNEWKSTEAWGETYYDTINTISDVEGVSCIKLEKTKTYEFDGKNSTKRENPYKGDTWDQHLRQIWIQDNGEEVSVMIYGIWFGTEAEYNAFIEGSTGFEDVFIFRHSNVNDNNAIYSINGRKLRTLPSRGLYIKNGRKYLAK